MYIQYLYTIRSSTKRDVILGF